MTYNEFVQQINTNGNARVKVRYESSYGHVVLVGWLSPTVVDHTPVRVVRFSLAGAPITALMARSIFDGVVEG